MQIRQIFKEAVISAVPLLSAQHLSPPAVTAWSVMSNHVQLSAAAGIPPQSINNVLSPGIVSLFIQGLETGLVLSQFAQWLSLDRKEGITITVLVLFVTTVGLSALLPFLSPR